MLKIFEGLYFNKAISCLLLTCCLGVIQNQHLYGQGFYSMQSLFDEDGNAPFQVGGWTQWGYTSDSTGLFNTDPHNFNNHQSWIYLERKADGSQGADWGFRFDMMYGTDADDTEAFGASDSWDNKTNWNHGKYGWALPQLYVELASGDWSVKIGHFFTLIGYEVVTAPDNFFYSHSLTMYLSEPFTHTGGIASYQATENLTLFGGWTAGWDTGFDRYEQGSNFLGGASMYVTDNLKLTYMTTVGDFGWRGEGYMHSLVADIALTDKWNYVIQSDLHETNNFVSHINHTIGVNQYLFYTINDYLRAGTRVEWWKANGLSFYQATLGLNIKPCCNLVIRPEIRQQWGSECCNLVPTDDTITGIDAILLF